MSGACVYLLPWVSTHWATSLLSRSASHLSAMPHQHVSCHLCCAFPLHHHRSSGLCQCRKVRPPPCPRRCWLGQDVLTRAGVQACAPFPASVTSHHTPGNTPGWLLPHLPTGGARKRNREKAEINSSLTSVHLLRVLPACQIKAPW